MIKQFHANKVRLRRHQRIRNRLAGSQERPRLNVFRSGHHIYAQVIDDTTGRTLVAASSLDESLRSFKPAAQSNKEQASNVQAEKTLSAVEVATEALPTEQSAERSARTEKASKGAQKGVQKGAPVKGGKAPVQTRTQLPAAEKRASKTPLEALAPIAHNRKVAIAREVGKLVAARAQEKGVSKVVFDRGGYAYHGRVASLAEGAREGGLIF